LFSEHSNKRGRATEAAKAGLNDNEIADIGDWTNVKTARQYIEQTTRVRPMQLPVFQ